MNFGFHNSSEWIDMSAINLSRFRIGVLLVPRTRYLTAVQYLDNSVDMGRSGWMFRSRAAHMPLFHAIHELRHWCARREQEGLREEEHGSREEEGDRETGAIVMEPAERPSQEPSRV